MKRRYICGLILFACYFATATADTLDERSVSQLMKAVELASAERDIDSLASLLADDVKVAITVVTDDQTISVEMNKEDYVSSVLQSWSVWDTYDYARDEMNIVLHTDHAVVTSTIREEGSLGDEVIRQASSNTSTVRNIGGRMLLTKITGHVVL
ncbi:MAG: hypothetical protein HKN70_02990 [Gammaproteobacteria bacterium]|nr:hypothetical protein [Gammaproteobacteria bacterium]